MSALGHSGVIEAAQSEIFLSEMRTALARQRLSHRLDACGRAFRHDYRLVRRTSGCRVCRIGFLDTPLSVDLWNDLSRASVHSLVSRAFALSQWNHFQPTTLHLRLVVRKHMSRQYLFSLNRISVCSGPGHSLHCIQCTC